MKALSPANIRKGQAPRALIRRDLKRNKWVYCMLIPILAYYLIFKYLPMFGTVMAFQNYKPALGILRSKWVGLENLSSFLNSHYAWRTIRNTLLINVYQIIFGFPMPILFALLLNELRCKPFKRVAQTVSYMPHFVSLIVVCGLLRIFTGSDGLINIIARIFGQDFGNLLAKAKFFRTIYVASGIWQSVGWSSIIYLATLSSVDPAQYEAASIDGAGRFRRIVHVTMPALVPIITVQLIMRLGHIMSEGYEKVILLYNEGTYETADIISSYVYRYGLEGGKFGRGAAVGLFNSLVNIAVLTSSNWISRKISEESLW